jgi:hypothetical protein
MHNNGAHKNNNDNNTTQLFIRLKKTKQKTLTLQDVSACKDKE